MSVHWGGRGAGHVSRRSQSATDAPSLSLNFLAGALDSRVTFTRASTGTFTGSNGLIQSAAINAPRFDYDPVTLAPKGLLIEEQRTNAMLQSQTLQTTWTRANILAFGSGSVIDAIAAPDGTISAEFIVPSTTGGVAHLMGQSVTHTLASYTISAYVKAGAYSKFAFRENTVLGTYATFNIGTGAVIDTSGTATIQNVGNGWYRCTLTYTGAAVSQAMGLYVLPASYTSGSPHLFLWAGDGTSGLYVWGVQDELGAFATSYIPTVAASITRSPDVASITGANFTSWYNATQGTFVADFDKYTTALRGGVLCAGNTSAGISTGISLDGQNDGKVRAYIENAGALELGNLTLANYTANTPIKAAIAYAVNDAVGAAAGALGTVDTSVVVPTVNSLQIGAIRNTAVAATFPINGHIRSINYYTSRLSNTKLQTLTQ